MQNFIIQINDFLKQNIQAFYHGNHVGWESTEIGYINTLKNDDGTFNDQKRDFGHTLSEAKEKLSDALRQDLPIIARDLSKELTICVVPRAKAENNYQHNQLLFKTTIQEVVNQLQGFVDGTDYIMRHTDTPTTHRGGKKPQNPGITKDTCTISNEVKGKNILLIDDLYTKTVNIDEDAIQALLDSGAQSVIFYAVGKTVYNEI